MAVWLVRVGSHGEFQGKFGANECLFVSWRGFKNNLQKELAGSFFRFRL